MNVSIKVCEGGTIQSRLPNGLFHCVDGPAYQEPGYEEWLVFGKHHRIGGPAVTCRDGSLEWWVNNVKCKSFAQYQELSGLSDEDMLILQLKYTFTG